MLYILLGVYPYLAVSRFSLKLSRSQIVSGRWKRKNQEELLVLTPKRRSKKQILSSMRLFDGDPPI